MVVVDDDVALPDLPQARSVAGTLFVHKIAGALAKGGTKLDEIARRVEKVITGTKTIGMSLDTCTAPGSPKEARIPKGMAEPGLGIHGEAGIEQHARQAMGAVVAKLAAHLADGNQVALLLAMVSPAQLLQVLPAP